MFEKNYILLDQSIKKVLSASPKEKKISRHTFISKVIEHYTSSQVSSSVRALSILKYFFWGILIALSTFSFYSAINAPRLKPIFEYTKNCTILKQPECPKEFNYEQWSEIDSKYISNAHGIWSFYTNIFMIILFLTYLPYRSLNIYKLFRGGDISLLSGVWRFIKVLLIIILFPSLTWWIGAFFGSIYFITYLSIMPVPYELFGTFSIPWIL